MTSVNSDFPHIETESSDAVRFVLNRDDLPTALPPLYGPRSWLMGLTAEPFTVLDVSPEFLDTVGISFDIVPVFTQDAGQKSYTDSIAAQASTQSIQGLKKHLESDKFTNERASAFLSMSLQVNAFVYIEGEAGNPDKDQEVFYGPIIQFPVSFDENVPVKDKKLETFLITFVRLYNMRIETLVNRIDEAVRTYQTGMSRMAESSAATFEDEEAALAGRNLGSVLPSANAEQLFEQQQRDAMDKAHKAYKLAINPPQKFGEILIKMSGVQELASTLRALQPTFAEGVTFRDVLQMVLTGVHFATQFADFGGDGYDQIDSDATAEDEQQQAA